VGAVEIQTINGGQFYVLDVTGQQIPDQILQQASVAMDGDQISEEVQQQLITFIRGQSISIAVGVLDDYLMISLGSDTSFLERWGTGESLATTKMLEPVRAHFEKCPASLTYTAANMTGQPLTSEDVENIAELVLQSIPQFDVPQELAERVRKDVK
jgi:hypothetical protein